MISIDGLKAAVYIVRGILPEIRVPLFMQEMEETALAGYRSALTVLRLLAIIPFLKRIFRNGIASTSSQAR